MKSRTVIIEPKILLGMSQRMTLSDNQTKSLWKRFMPRRGEVLNRATNDYVSMQVYDPAAGAWFLPTTVFEKWAVVEVRSCDSIPEGMRRYDLAGGEYAVFEHKGPASDYPDSIRFIFGQWLPESDYELDQREQFEILPEEYDPVDAEAEEEIWIPIR